jgi:hypothetical protein
MRFGAALDLWSKSERSEPRGESEQRPQASRSGGKSKVQPSARQSRSSTPRTDPETGEIPEPPNVQAAIESLDQDGRKQLQEKMTAANFPPVEKLPTAAARQVVKWAEEIRKAAEQGEPF